MNEEPTRKRWPVDPTQYPLSGPSRGPVALPARAPHWLVRALIRAALWLDERL